MDSYKVLRTLGDGGFGVTKLCQNLFTGEINAIKFIPHAFCAAKEIFLQSKLDHDNVVQLVRSFKTSEHTCIVMEFMDGGDLFDKISPTISEENAKHYFMQLISAVEYMHQNNICHRDIKPENILINNDDTIKLCDFGFATEFSTNTQKIDGSPDYIAPEILSQNVEDPWTPDIWSCGVTLFVMVLGYCPFRDPNDPDNLHRTFENIRKGRFTISKNAQISYDLQHLIESILVPNPKKRYTINDIKRHPWLLPPSPSSFASFFQTFYDPYIMV